MLNIKNLFNNILKRLFKTKLTLQKNDSEIYQDIINKANSIVNHISTNSNSETPLKESNYLNNKHTNIPENSTTTNKIVTQNNNIIQNHTNNKHSNTTSNVEDTQNTSVINKKINNLAHPEQKNIFENTDLKSKKNDPTFTERIIYTHNKTSVKTQEKYNQPASNIPTILQNEDTYKNIPTLEEEYKKLKLDLSILNQNDKSINIPTSKSYLSSFIKLLIFKRKNYFWILVSLIILNIIFIFYFTCISPDCNFLEEYTPKTITRIYSNDGYIVSELGLQNRSITNIENIPPIIKDAFISAEDKTFYSNSGFDFKAIIRSLINNSLRIVDKNRSLMGASTITQQVVKNILLNHDRTLIRKVKEAILTIKLEFNLSKERILEIYLNEIYLGNGSYGVTTAALRYFNKPLNALTLEEAAFLAILPKSPNGYNPKINYEGAKSRRDWVINRMLEDNKITQQQAKEAMSKPILITKRTDLAINYSSYAAEEARKKVFSIIPSHIVYNDGLIVKTTLNSDLQRFAYYSLRNGIERVDNIKGYRGPIGNIFENNNYNKELDYKIDDIEQGILFVKLLNKYIGSNEILQKNLDDWEVAVVTKVNKNKLVAFLDNSEEIELDIKDNTWAVPNQEVYNLKRPITHLTSFGSILQKGDIVFVQKEIHTTEVVWKLKQLPKVNGAMLVMNPINGYILAMQGGFSFELSQFNRATQALRQPGSSFKSFVYLAALEKGMNPASLVLDAPYTVSTKDKIWKPKNNANRYAGYVTMRNALEVSRNLASIRIANFAGLEAISDVAKRLGIYSNNINNFAEVIGSKETTLIRMVKAYSILANGGKNIEPTLVNQIFNREGKVIFKHDNRNFNEFNNIPWEDQQVPCIPDNRESLIDERDAYLITNMLEGVVNRGIAGRAKIDGYNIGGKTGTTNDSKDLWFFGLTPQVVVGIYIGEDTPVNLEPAMASTMVVPIFKEFAMKAFPLLFDKIPFRIPEGIEMIWIDPKTGKPVSEDTPKKLLESFRSDNKPSYKTGSINLIEEVDNNLYEGIY